MLTSLHRTAV